MDMTNRTACCVPFCRRTFKTVHEGEEVICGKHWRLASPVLRKRLGKFRRVLNRLHEQIGPGPVWDKAAWQKIRRFERLEKVHNQVWKRIQAQAIEGSALNGV